MRKQLIEWGIFFGFLGVLYFTGLHTNLASGMQTTIAQKPAFFNANEGEVGENTTKEKANYDMGLIALDGSRASLAELEGKTIFMNFWATWCPPCIAEMPSISALYNDTKEGNVVFVMISQDNDSNKAREFIKQKKYDFPVYFLASPIPDAYRGRSIPRTYIISPDGYVAAKETGLTNYDTEEFKDFLISL